VTSRIEDAKDVIQLAATKAEAVVETAAHRAEELLLRYAEERTEAIAERAAERAVIKTLLAIGIDISSPGSILRAQDNFSFLDTLNSGQKAVKRKVGLTAIGVLVTGLIGYVLLVFGWGGSAAH
jgi:hypothetical protein